jgi:hypothetical protein
MTSLSAKPLTLGQYIQALVAALGDTYPAALARMHLIVGDRRARIFLDDEGVEIVFGAADLEVYPVTEDSGISGEGATDTDTVLNLLGGYLEVTDAILSGRLRASGSVEDIVRMFGAIEILLDASPRTPALQALAFRFQSEKAEKRRPVPTVVHENSYPFYVGVDELKLLRRLGLMPNISSTDLV